MQSPALALQLHTAMVGHRKTPAVCAQADVCPCWHSCMETHCFLLGFYCHYQYQEPWLSHALHSLQKSVGLLTHMLMCCSESGLKSKRVPEYEINLFMALEAVWTTQICYLFTNSNCHYTQIRRWQQNKTLEFSYKDCHRLIQRQFQIRQTNPCPNFPSSIMNCWFSSGIHIFSSKRQRIFFFPQPNVINLSHLLLMNRIMQVHEL